MGYVSGGGHLSLPKGLTLWAGSQAARYDTQGRVMKALLPPRYQRKPALGPKAEGRHSSGGLRPPRGPWLRGWEAQEFSHLFWGGIWGVRVNSISEWYI